MGVCSHVYGHRRGSLQLKSGVFLGSLSTLFTEKASPSAWSSPFPARPPSPAPPPGILCCSGAAVPGSCHTCLAFIWLLGLLTLTGPMLYPLSHLLSPCGCFALAFKSAQPPPLLFNVRIITGILSTPEPRPALRNPNTD